MIEQQDMDNLLKQGEDLFTSGDLLGAQDCFKKILDINPRHIQALNNIGVISFQRADFKNAMDYFNKALEIDRLYTEAIENYSKCLIAVGEYPGALKFIRDSIQLGVSNTEILNIMGECFVALKDLKSAQVIFNKSLSLNHEQDEIFELLDKIEGGGLENNDLNPPADSDYRQSSKNVEEKGKPGDKNFDYKLYWEQRYSKGGDSGSGSYGDLARFKAEVINEFIRSTPITSTIEFGCGDGNQLSLIEYPDYTGLDISETAVNICTQKYGKDIDKHFFTYSPTDYKNLNLEPADLVVCLDVLYHIIDESDFINTLDAIFTHSKKYIILYTIVDAPPNQTAAHIKHREIHRYLNKYPEFEILKTIEQKYPDISSAAFIILGKKDIARSTIYQDIENSSDLLKQGEDLFISGNMEEAEGCFKKILEDNPDHIEALNNIGVISFMRSDFKTAMEYFTKTLEIDQSYSKAIENYSKCLIALGEPLEAIEFIQKSLKKGTINTELLNIMGNCFIELKDLRSAKLVFEQSLSLNNSQKEIIALVNEINSTLEEKSQPASRMNIGFISIWFERGQSYVTKIIRDCLSSNHNTFIFARTGGVYGEAKLENKGMWDVPNLTTYPEYKIPADVLKKWIKDNDLHAVVFNEEYDWGLVRTAKETGVKVITYLDYYKDEWKRDIGLYDVVMCSTLRTYNLVKNICRAYYIGWGVDTELFRPINQHPEFTFFHNAGWLGINYRKMTPAVIAAFDSISRVLPDISLFIHSQVELEKLPPVIVDIVRNNPNIVFHEETVPAPGLYHKGKIMLFPTKLEGLGLPLFEALSSGLPVITTNAPPMNEFVRDGYNGLLVNVAFRTTRDDNVAFPEEIVDMGDLAIKMAKLANNNDMCIKLSRNARSYSEESLSLSLLGERILKIF